MRKQSRLKENQQEKRIPAPKLRREPLPMSISVKHHLPIGVEGTATDLTVAELEKMPVNPPKPQLDYSTSQVKPISSPSIKSKPQKNTQQSVIPNFEQEIAPSFSSKLDKILDLDFSENLQDLKDLKNLDQDLELDQDLVDQDLDQDLKDLKDLDQDLDQLDLKNLNLDYEEDLETNIDPYTYSLFAQETNFNKSETKVQRTANAKPQRSINNIDLNIQSRFVRVPNWVADQLARQLSPAEEKIFDQIWRLTVGFNREVWRGKIADLMIRTGYSSRATVTKALAGLSALNLIRIEGRDTNPRGRSYKIVDKVISNQEEKTSQNLNKNARKLSSQDLDLFQKFDQSKLVEQTSSQAKTYNSTKNSSTTHLKSSQLAESKPIKSKAENTENKGFRPLVESSSQAFKNNFRKKDDSGYSPSSSDREDDEKFSQVRLIYQDLTGNQWLMKDEISYQELAKIPIPYIILGICYSISRASDHKISSLKYCVPSICEHYELMRVFPQKDLLEIAYRHLVLVKEAQKNGKWF